MTDVLHRTTHFDRVWNDECDVVLIPKGATVEERLRLAYPVVPPPPGSKDAEAWTRLGLEPAVWDAYED